jgi:hypothetical protein
VKITSELKWAEQRATEEFKHSTLPYVMQMEHFYWCSALPSWGRNLLRVLQLASCCFGVLSKQQISAGYLLGGREATNLIAPDEIHFSGSSCARPCSRPPAG